MTTSAKMKAEPVPQSVRIRANLAALGLRRGQETDTTLTPMIQGAIDSGVLSLVDDEPAPKRRPKRRGARGNSSV